MVVAVLIPINAGSLEGNFEVHLNYDPILLRYYVVAYSDCCKVEFIDGPVKGDTCCGCGKSSWRKGPGARCYISEAKETNDNLIKWLDYWIVPSALLKVDIKWS